MLVGKALGCKWLSCVTRNPPDFSIWQPGFEGFPGCGAMYVEKDTPAGEDGGFAEEQKLCGES